MNNGAYAYSGGWKVVWRHELGEWVCADTLESYNTTERPCKHCGKHATEEGHDACLGTLPGVRSACCGHGVPGERKMLLKELWYFLKYGVNKTSPLPRGVRLTTRRTLSRYRRARGV